MFQIDRLIIFGGLSCSGKSTLLDRIQSGGWPRLCRQLGIEEPATWRKIRVKEWARLDDSPVTNLLLHYDFHVQHSRAHGFRYLHEVIRHAQEVEVLTLCAPSNVLARRHTSRLRRSLTFAGIRKNRMKQFCSGLQKQRFLRREDDVARLYENWFSALADLPADCKWLIDTTAEQTDQAMPYDPQILTDLIANHRSVRREHKAP